MINFTMDSPFLHHPFSEFSSPSSSFASNSMYNFKNQPLPFNENDSQEMLLYGVLAGDHEEIVHKSLHEMKYGYKEGSSPVLELKRRYSMKRKSKCKKKKEEENRVENVVVFEDLGPDYLEELLNMSERPGPW
ncbi:hypothetical protein FH972_006331 [Carpinus fangiana]|uniref:Uncharacterized protein n=1 Tax=Carpinus fangiana TaxID=176857 RepID=A0A5N6QSY3_9ROSI|nr:hypothetical protein FH972_006331 [Carpinus fangiana]